MVFGCQSKPPFPISQSDVGANGVVPQECEETRPNISSLLFFQPISRSVQSSQSLVDRFCCFSLSSGNSELDDVRPSMAIEVMGVRNIHTYISISLFEHVTPKRIQTRKSFKVWYRETIESNNGSVVLFTTCTRQK